MELQNPYAPPAEDPGSWRPVHGGACWREGDAVVVRRPEAELPDRCVRCNEPAQGYRLQRKLYWHHPGLYVVLVISPLIYVIIALIVRKTTSVTAGLCPVHRARRKNGLLIGWIGVPVSLVACGTSIATDTPEAIVGGFLLFFVCLIAGAVMAQVVVPKKMDQNHAWLRVGQPFLDSISGA
jgi:hypothetical protein